MTARREAPPRRAALPRSKSEVPADPTVRLEPRTVDRRHGLAEPIEERTPGESEPFELRRLRRRIDALDRRIVALLNERARLALAVGRAKRAAGWRAVRDTERERDVLERVAAANAGPLPEAALLAVYRRVIAATRALEARRNGLDEEA